MLLPLAANPESVQLMHRYVLLRSSLVIVTLINLVRLHLLLALRFSKYGLSCHNNKPIGSSFNVTRWINAVMLLRSMSRKAGTDRGYVTIGYRRVYMRS